jgi:hypothetical protein
MTQTFYPIPPTETPEDTVCVVLRVPNSLEWLSAVHWILDQYNYWYNWQRTDDKRGKAVAERWRLIFWEVMNGGGLEGCATMLTDVRQNETDPCKLEKQIDEGAYIEFADLQKCPPRMRMNEGRMQWFDGENWVDLPGQGEESEDGTAPPPFPDPPPGEEGNCLAAENLTALLQSQVNEWITALTAGAIALGIVTIITGVLSAFFIPYATPAILGFATTLLGIGYEALETAFTSEVYDRFKCIIYCNASPDGSITLDQYEDIQSEVDAETGTAWDLISVWVQFFGSVGFTRAGNAAGITTGDCSCAECSAINITYDYGSGAAAVAVGDEFEVTPSNEPGSGGYSFFALHFDQCVEVQWVSGAGAIGAPGFYDFYWRAGTGSPACPGASDTYYLTTTDAAAVNAHIGETHPANYMSSGAQTGRGVVVLKIVSIYEP